MNTPNARPTPFVAGRSAAGTAANVDKDVRCAEKARIGVVGCGFISERYLENLTRCFRNTEVVAVTDALPENARLRAEQFQIGRVCASADELVSLPDVDIVVILTPPSSHSALARLALEAGKHVYTEKPLALDMTEGRQLVELARQRGLLLGAAPDTFLGSGLQTARKLIDEGWIGKPIGASCQLLRPGPESWHPDPAFLYAKGAGPLFDSGPYFVTALAYLFGPTVKAICLARTTYAERTITSQPRYGQKIPVEVPTFVSGLLEFESGVLASMMLSVDTPFSRQQDPRQHNHTLEVYGSDGTLSLPSPCWFDGQIYYRRTGMADWVELPSLFCYRDNNRGVGVADLASAVLHGRPPRLSADLSLHALEVMCAMDASSQTGSARSIDTRFAPTEPMSPSTQLGDVDVS